MTLPGDARHKEILETILEFYGADGRVRSVILFGSLSRGNWDQYSDLDLDIILTDEVDIDARVELDKLGQAIEQKHGYQSLIIADVEEGDVVLSNLVQFSIRYHTLSDTKPAILETMHVLAGSLTAEKIQAAANHAYDPEPVETADLVNQYLRYALGLHDAIQRRRVWMSLEMLHRMRALLMEMQAAVQGEIRPIHHMDLTASPDLPRLLTQLTPEADLPAITSAFAHSLTIVENHLDAFTGGTYKLTPSQTIVLAKLKQLRTMKP